jgi:DNA gyrase subunit A
VQLDDAAGLMLISNHGTLVRTRAAEVARVGRNTQGVRLIKLPADEVLVGVDKLDPLENDDAEEDEGGNDANGGE